MIAMGVIDIHSLFALTAAEVNFNRDKKWALCRTHLWRISTHPEYRTAINVAVRNLNKQITTNAKSIFRSAILQMTGGHE